MYLHISLRRLKQIIVFSNILNVLEKYGNIFKENKIKIIGVYKGFLILIEAGNDTTIKASGAYNLMALN